MHAIAKAAIDSLKKSLELNPKPLSQVRRQMLMSAGLSHGQIERMSKGILPELPAVPADTDLKIQKANRNDVRQNRNVSKAMGTWLGPGLFVRKLQKAYGGYRSLVKTMLVNGYSKERVKEMLNLTEAEFVDFQKD